MAMAMSMLVLPDLPIPLDEPGVVRKSYPGFWEEWAKFGYALQPLN
jgi:5-enolpyruvylshikimate-3-phosphate synthase